MNSKGLKEEEEKGSRQALPGGKNMEDDSEHDGSLESMDDEPRSHPDMIMDKYLKDQGEMKKRHGFNDRELGCAFRNFTVLGQGGDIGYADSVGSLLTQPLRMGEIISELRHPMIKKVLNNFNGHIKPGKVILVLGRPGAGCSTFLKSIANQRGSFTGFEGIMSYDGLSHKDMAKHFQGEIAYLPEDDVHFPTLKVEETIRFAAATKVPHQRQSGETEKDYIERNEKVILDTLGLGKVGRTKVGNDIVPGVSGGQRKRVGIAEMMAVNPRIACWDNVTRGLDSSTALELVRALRALADHDRMTSILSLYQAGEQIYELVDDVCVIHSGQMIYFGPAQKAKAYFLEMGYEPVDSRQTTPDFLIAVTNPKARIQREDVEHAVPHSAEEMVQYWEANPLGKANIRETEEYLASFSQATKSKFVEGFRAVQHPRASKSGPFLVPLWTQLKASLVRQYQIQKGDAATIIFTSAATIIQSLIFGSIFYQMPKDTSGFFSRGGVIFFAILFNAFTAMAEITISYSQRPIVYRQKGFAMYHPGFDAISKLLLDLPTKAIVIVPFDIILYFMSGLQYTASQFFIFLLFTYITTLAMIVFFRLLASSTPAEAFATMLAGLAILCIAVYTGYVLPRTQMHGYFKWISYINPISYSFEALLANEFYNLNVPCVGLIPSGPGYTDITPSNQVCPVKGYVGQDSGTNLVLGELYIEQSFGYRRDHLWRNFGIILAFWGAFIALYVLTYEYLEYGSNAKSVRRFKRGSAPAEVKDAIKADAYAPDEEKGRSEERGLQDGHEIDRAPESRGTKVRKTAALLEQQKGIFTWQNVNFHLQVDKESKQLLHDVSGWVKPGTLTALMGESGAGKTTLLNALAQRLDIGVVTGSMLVDAKPLSRSFQRQTGYCQQQDLHLETATVREALRFSAALRQPASVPLSEKYAYVENVIEMMEMGAWAEAIVGQVGSGLNVEQRKRLTIGVELAAKPSLLLFLDEPTSGLDSQSAWSVVTFCRQLADAGQAVLCTIHQPSAELFQVFDRLLLLRVGGETVYFGDIGESSATVINYFQANGARPCRKMENPAEYILDVLGAGASAVSDIDWYEKWVSSSEKRVVEEELNRLHEELRVKPAIHNDNNDEHRDYAAGFSVQFYQVFKRLLCDYWRDPTYISAKIGLNIIGGLFIGFSFWKSPNSPFGFQNYLFAIFMALVLCTVFAQQMQPKFIAMRSLYEVRERPSKMYNAIVMGLTNVLIEIPYNVVGGTIFFMCWYWGIGTLLLNGQDMLANRIDPRLSS